MIISIPVSLETKKDIYVTTRAYLLYCSTPRNQQERKTDTP